MTPNQTDNVHLDFSQFDLTRRCEPRQLELERQAVASWDNLRTFLDPLPNFAMVLNVNRQVVFANQALLTALEVSDLGEVLGKRPGECLQCERAFETPHGCGNSEACRSCGALTAILRSRQNQADTQECRLLIRGGRPLELQVRTFPVSIGRDLFTVLHATDVGGEKRRRSLERIFFHDILNHAGAIKGLISYLNQYAALDDEGREMTALARTASEWLMETIHSQKDLLAAEEGSLSIRIAPLQSRQVLRDMVSLYQCHPCAENRHIHIDESAQDIAFESDGRLLVRVLGNLATNALEASEPGQNVRVTCRRLDDGVSFSVQNSAVMPPDVQHQIFRRFFSSKGPGRGLGTYSIKLLTEEYLKGKVAFTSRAPEGTTFTVRLPLQTP